MAWGEAVSHSATIRSAKCCHSDIVKRHFPARAAQLAPVSHKAVLSSHKARRVKACHHRISESIVGKTSICQLSPAESHSWRFLYPLHLCGDIINNRLICQSYCYVVVVVTSNESLRSSDSPVGSQMSASHMPRISARDGVSWFQYAKQAW